LSGSASNATTGTPGQDSPSTADVARDVSRTGAYATLGFGEGAVPFGTALSAALPPSDPRDRFDLGAGQLAGAVSLLFESAALAAGGAGAAVTCFQARPPAQAVAERGRFLRTKCMKKTGMIVDPVQLD
jgi:hypothetical protein